MLLTHLSILFAFFATSLAKRKAFVDNDGITALNVFLPLLADIEIVGLSASFGDPSFVDSIGQASDLRKNYSLSCIPLYGGAEKPLLRTNETFYVWQDLFGEFVWKGAWDPSYKNAYNYSQASYDKDIPAAVALVNAVKTYPGEVEIYAAGLMTTVAQAISLYPNLPKEAKGLWIMGGYIDGQFAQATQGNFWDDINTDFNLMFDPEAAEIVLTSPWKDLLIGGNVTNYVFTPKSLLNQLSKEFDKKNHTDPKFSAVFNFVESGNSNPLWDEAVSGFLAFPDVIDSYVEMQVAVDTCFSSPFYGNLRIWPKNLAPKKAPHGTAKYVTKIDDKKLFEKIHQALLKDWTSYCKSNGTIPELI